MTDNCCNFLMNKIFVCHCQQLLLKTWDVRYPQKKAIIPKGIDLLSESAWKKFSSTFSIAYLLTTTSICTVAILNLDHSARSCLPLTNHLFSLMFTSYCVIDGFYYFCPCLYFSFVYLLGFYGIPTIVGYLMPNPFYTNKHFYFKQFSLA